MDQLFFIRHPEPLMLEAKPIDHATTPQGSVALGYFHDGHILARGFVSQDALEAINGLLENPVSLALAAAEDEHGNIDARVCLVLPVNADKADASDERDEPWRSSVPSPPPGIEDDYASGGTNGMPKLALLPIGSVVRGARYRNHTDVASDAREMLDNLLAGRSGDAVQQAIDDLLDSI